MILRNDLFLEAQSIPRASLSEVVFLSKHIIASNRHFFRHPEVIVCSDRLLYDALLSFLFIDRVLQFTKVKFFVVTYIPRMLSDNPIKVIEPEAFRLGNFDLTM